MFIVTNMHKRKTIPPTLRPERRAYRIPRSEPDVLRSVLAVVNGEVWKAERYGPERSLVRQTLDRIIEYCDRVEETLADTEKTRTQRIEDAAQIADTIDKIFDLLPRKFTVLVVPRRERREPPSPISELPLHVARNVAALLDPHVPLSRSVPASAEELFHLKALFFWPVGGDIRTQLLWECYQGVIQLDDLRRLRKCSAHPGHLHDEPYYFVRKKVERKDNYFCSPQCRSDFNYKKLTERVNQAKKRKPS